MVFVHESSLVPRRFTSVCSALVLMFAVGPTHLGAQVPAPNLVRPTILEDQPPAGADNAVTPADEKEAALLYSICAMRNDPVCIASLAKQGWKPDLLNEAGETALFVAIASDAPEAAQALIDAGADPALQVEGRTAEEFALVVGRPELVRVVVRDVQERADALLQTAAGAGRADLIGEALAMGADPGKQGAGGAAPVHAATISRSADAVQALLDGGAAVDAVDEEGVTPLAIAISLKDTEVAAVLLKAKADPNKVVEGLLPLSLAAISGSEEMIKLLLEHDADPEEYNDDGTRPALVAQMAGHQGLVAKLGGIEGSARPSILKAIKASSDGELAAALLRSPEDSVDERDPAGNTALMHSAASGYVGRTITLLSFGADVLAQNNKGETVLHAALSNSEPLVRTRVASEILIVAHQRQEIAELLALKDNTGRSVATLFAMRWGHGLNHFADDVRQEVSRLQLDADFGNLATFFTISDGDGVTPLAAAVISQNATAVKLLVEAGVHPDPVGTTTLQELARAAEDWATLFFLPDDRIIPEGIKAGATRADLEDLQRRLVEWGYYPGPVDGVLGAGSKTALRQFLEDRREEVIEIGRIAGKRDWPGLYVDTIKDAAEGKPKFGVLISNRGTCTWKYVLFNETRLGKLEELFGCFRGDIAPGAGVAMVKFAGETDGLFFFGEKGWEEKVELR